MLLDSNSCPTFWRIGRFLWDSPTFTTWGNYAIQSLRLFFITPLILTRFDETEIAAWYLFGSLNFIGSTVGQRLMTTFSRMFAFAMGGASDLAPIKGKREQENEGKPNWSAFERAYGTVGTLNFGLAWVNVLIAVGMGWYGLNNIVDGYEAQGMIWMAFGVMQATSLIGSIFQRYMIALQGMNYVALCGRVGMVNGLVSVLGGVVCLALGGGMLALVMTTQLLSLLSLFCFRYLLGVVEGGRVATFKAYGFDREIAGWSWAPTWKGVLVGLSGNGVVQIAAILASGRLPVSEVGSYLFTVRMCQTFQLVSFAPFGAVVPLMSRYLAQGDYLSLRRLVFQRSLLTLGCLFTALLGLILIGNYALGYLDTNMRFLTGGSMLALGFFGILARYQAICVHVVLLGNKVVLMRRRLLGALLSLVCLYLFGSSTVSIILFSMGISILVMGFEMTREAATILSVSIKTLLRDVAFYYLLASFFVLILFCAM